MTYFLTDILSAVLTLDCLLYDRVVGDPIIHIGNGIQSKADTEEIYAFIDECPAMIIRKVYSYLTIIAKAISGRFLVDKLTHKP